MGSYTFKWEHPAEEVYVTGTFDNWTKSVKLDKRGDIFEKTVNLEIPSDKVYYKFVVDNNWTTNESSPKEADKEGNINNFLTSEVIAASTFSTASINTAAPGSTTATMAGQQPLEKDKLVGVNPLPASETGVNPINLKPGEKVPQDLAAGDIHKHVKLDKESYEKSDSLVGIPNPADVPAAGANTIPESSLPMPQNATINTVAPGATTAGLAGQVPVESKAAEPTSGAEDKKKKKNKKKNEKKKQKKAAAAAANGNGNANANATDDDDHSDEAENKGDSGAAATAATVGGSAAAVAAAVAAGATAAGGKVTEQAAPTANAAKSAATEALNKNLPEDAKQKLPEMAKETLGQQKTAEDVPAKVETSIQEAGKGPEAAANEAAVEEKKAVESELLEEVKPAPAVDAPKAEQKPAAAATTEKATEKPAEKATEKPAEKPTETAKAPALATAAPVVAPAAAKHALPAENGSAKVADEASGPKPAEPKPTDTKVSVSKPVTLTPTPPPAETKTADASTPKVAEVPKPAEPTPAVSKPVESKPAESKPAESKPAESKPAESKPAESKPAESKPAETKPAETKPAETKPAEKPAEKPTTATSANGSGSKPTTAGSTSKTDAAAEKKKGRLSTFISKLKGKLSDKN